MSRTVRRTLRKVSIGPYIPNEGQVPTITLENETGEEGSLSDPRLGILEHCDGDRALCFGTMGSIPLGQYMVNPMFEEPLLEYLNMFDLSNGILHFKSGIRDAINKNGNLIGYRKMKEISRILATKGTRWSINTTNGNVVAKYRTSTELSPTTLREILTDATNRYTSGREVVHLSELGINIDASRPENFIISSIPVMPITMRRPTITGKDHQYTKVYKAILSAVRSRQLSNIRAAYLQLIAPNEEASLRDDVFSSKKNGFIRGSMLSKTGGQIARSVAGASIHLKPYEIGIPRRFALDLSQRVVVTDSNIPEIQSMMEQGHITHILDRRTGQYINIRDAQNITLVPNQMLVLRQLMDGDAVIANRQPTLHRNGMLAFKVVLHDDDVIYTHPSVSSGFGLDYDGDELNIIVPYSELGKKEANELMFVTYHMASMASSNLLVGYHQDVNLGAHMMTMTGTMVGQRLWTSVSRIIYDLLWATKYGTYEEWVQSFRSRCDRANVDMYHGRSLYSALLPEDFNWRLGNARIENGILMEGTINKSVASSSPGSIGMILYRVYGVDDCVQWLNASYMAMNEYLVKTGITLGISDIELPASLQERVRATITRYLRHHEDIFGTPPSGMRSEVKARYNAAVLQDLNNIRERVSKMIIEELMERHTLWASRVELHMGDIDTTMDHAPDGILMLEYENPVEVVLDMYDGSITVDGRTYSMGVFPLMIIDGTEYRRTKPSPLLLMTKSGARGNETNIIQISGIIGQQSFANDRIPLMMSGGTRSMPCFDFGEDTPESRGHISTSYMEGMSPADYMSAHVASRENLTSNTSLTPDTGYFGRRLRVFTENLAIKRHNGRQLVMNERNVPVMWDFMLDPSRLYNIGGRRTFIDVAHELNTIRGARSRDAIIVPVPVRRRLEQYVPIARNIQAIRDLYPTTDIIVSMHPTIEGRFPDFYDHMRNRYITITNGEPYWYLRSQEYDRFLVIPSNVRLRAIIDMDKLPDGFHINVGQASIGGVSYQAKQGEPIPACTLYDMITLGTEFTRYPMVLRSNIDAVDDETLLLSMIRSGTIYSM